MDRKIEKKRFTSRTIGWIVAIPVILATAIYGLTHIGGASTLKVKTEHLTISSAQNSEFNEYIALYGEVSPINSFYLDAVQGGQILKINIEEGSFVKVGDTIMQMDNTDLLLDIMFREAQLFEQENFLRNTRLAIQQNSLHLKSELLEIDRSISRAKREYEQAKTLFNRELISQYEFDSKLEEYNYWSGRRELTIETQRQDSILRTIQIEQLEASVKRLLANQEIIRKKLENLTVTAPVTGHLTSLHAEVGELKGRGERLGQIDVLDGFRITASVDEYYVSRIAAGQKASALIDNDTYPMKVTKVYTEITEGRFKINLEFVEQHPENIRRGQSVPVKVVLGDLETALLIPRGAFYNSTGGRWIFVVDESGSTASKRDIKVGKYNPDNYEIIEGLEAGEKIITSAYDRFKDFKTLELID